MATKAAKKSPTAKKAGAKKTATKTAAKRGTTGVRARRQQEKIEEERARYQAKIEANERRLRAGETADGKPLTPEQIKTTEDILARQRQHVADITTYESGDHDADPR